jgi:hypothetical protein
MCNVFLLKINAKEAGNYVSQNALSGPNATNTRISLLIIPIPRHTDIEILVY